MARKTRYYNDPAFNKWLYTVLTDLTPAQKGLLNDKELYSIRDHTAIKRFVNSAPQERIDILLTKIGIRVARVYYATGKLNAQVVKDTYTQYHNKFKQLDVIEEMLRQDFFVVSDRNIALCLSLMSMNCHSGFYAENQELRTVVKNVSLLQPKPFGSPALNVSQREAEEGLTHLSRLLFASMSIEAYLKGKYGLTPADLVILLLLFYHRGRYATIGYLQRMTATMYSKAVIARRASMLFMEWHYIDRLTASSEVAKYTIMSKGMLVVSDIIRHLTNVKLD